ncbi:hypothetical protein ACLOJK_028634 [Asimina triloba]
MERRKSLLEIEVEDIVRAGLYPTEARAIHGVLKSAIARAGSRAAARAEELWGEVARGVLRPSHPHALHQLLYYSAYARWDSAANGPPPYWSPSPLALSTLPSFFFPFN